MDVTRTCLAFAYGDIGEMTVLDWNGLLNLSYLKRPTSSQITAGIWESKVLEHDDLARIINQQSMIQYNQDVARRWNVSNGQLDGRALSNKIYMRTDQI